MSKLAPLLVLVIVALMAGCGSDSTPGPSDEVEAVPFASTKMLTTADLSSLQPDKEDGKLVFDRAPAALADVAVGTVMVAGISPSTPHGFMRVVSSVTRSGDVLTLQTMATPPQLAYRKLHARVARPVSLDSAEPQLVTSLDPLAGGTSERQTPVNVILFDGDGNKETTDDQLRIEGFFKGAITYDLALDIDWGAVDKLPGAVTECLASLLEAAVGKKKPSCKIEDLIPEVKVKFTVEPSVASDLHMVGEASLAFEKEFDIAAVPLTPLVLGPLVFLPRLEVIAKVEGGASATFKTGVAGHMTLTTSVTVSSKTAGNPTFSPPAIKDKGFTFDEPVVGLHAHAKANAGVRLTMPLYGTIGPFATAEATLSLEADASKTPCWELRAGLESVVGAKITTPSLGFLGHVTLVDWKTAPFKAIDEVVASGACKDPPPGASRLPPGSGPDAPALRDPLFTPWSHVDDNTIAATENPGPSVSGISFSDLDRAIDGRWLVAASEARSLVKVDDTGRLIWRANFVAGDPETELVVLRTAPARDGSIVALAGGAIGASFSILRLGQSGGVKSARSYVLPIDLCATPAARVLAPDVGAGAGLSVLGECLSQGTAFAIHLDAAGNVTDARQWALDGAGHFGPNTFTRTTTSQLAVTGVLSGAEGDGMFVARLDESATIAAIDQYLGCDAALNLSPNALAPAAANGLLVAGGSFAQGRAFVTRIQEDGSVGFVTYPGIVDGNSPLFVANAIAELPTTGFVMSVSTVELTGSGAAAVPGIALLGLDATGRTAWNKRYALAGHSASFPALRLTTDGGALVASSAFVSGSAGGTWTMKAFAKDGTVADPNVTASTLTLNDGPTDCALRRVAITPKVTDLAVEVSPLSVIRR